MTRIIFANLLSLVLMVSFVGCGNQIHHHHYNDESAEKPLIEENAADSSQGEVEENSVNTPPVSEEIKEEQSQITNSIASSDALSSDVTSAVNSNQSVSSEVVSSQKEQTSSVLPSKISRDEAKAIALKDAGFKENEIREFEIELDKDDGIWLYEIEFKKDRVEYKYEINAENGKILEKEKDID